MKKNQIIIISVILFLIFCVIFYLGFLKEKFKGGSFETGEEGKIEEIFSLSGRVVNVNSEQKFLIVKLIDKETEVKVIISEETKLIKLEAPFPEDKIPPPGTQFTPKEKEITLADFKTGDEILVKTLKNIAGKNEFNDVEFIQILP